MQQPADQVQQLQNAQMQMQQAPAQAVQQPSHLVQAHAQQQHAQGQFRPVTQVTFNSRQGGEITEQFLYFISSLEHVYKHLTAHVVGWVSYRNAVFYIIVLFQETCKKGTSTEVHVCIPQGLQKCLR